MKYPVAFYNVGPVGENGRGPRILERELRAIARTRPKIVGLCETIGWGDLPNLEGYVKVRDRSTESRANIAAYVRNDLAFDPDEEVRWHDLTETWQRTEGPGQHPPRSILELTVDLGQWFIGHQAPVTRNGDTLAAQQEGIDLLTRRMTPWNRDDWSARSETSRRRAKKRLRVVLWDPNRSPTADGPGPKMLARRIEGWVAGTPIEGGVVRGGHFADARKQAEVSRVRLGSDHHGAFFATVVPR